MRRRRFITLLGGAAAWPLATQSAMLLVRFFDSRSPEALVQRAVHMLPLYSLDRLLNGNRPYSEISDKGAVMRENYEKRRRYSDGIGAQSGDLQTNLVVVSDSNHGHCSERYEEHGHPLRWRYPTASNHFALQPSGAQVDELIDQRLGQRERTPTAVLFRGARDQGHERAVRPFEQRFIHFSSASHCRPIALYRSTCVAQNFSMDLLPKLVWEARCDCNNILDRICFPLDRAPCLDRITPDAGSRERHHQRKHRAQAADECIAYRKRPGAPNPQHAHGTPHANEHQCAERKSADNGQKEQL